MKLENSDTLLKDMYPQPGTRIKQWVVDTRREREWEVATSPTVSMIEHEALPTVVRVHSNPARRDLCALVN